VVRRLRSRLRPRSPRRARALDGDFKKLNPLTAQVKDSDGDYKAASSPAASSSGAVQSALTTLRTGR
jgi:hypothetical protein